MAHKYSPAHIIEIIQETEMVRRFFFKVPDDNPFNFKPGQFVMLNLPIDSKYKNRSYSIASPPYGDNTFELVIVLNPKGFGTPYLWDHVKVGSEVEISKPLGKFVLQEPVEEDLCFIGTGTGIAPLRAMLHHMERNQLAHKNLFLVFGNRWEKDILYREEFEDLEKKLTGFKFIPVLSRDNEGWNGKKGYVHAVYEELFSDKRPATFYICGWRDMLVEARQRIDKMGYDKKKIKFESYD
jgi:CDP-4-dehydro-6-deoxyglucose reductase